MARKRQHKPKTYLMPAKWVMVNWLVRIERNYKVVFDDQKFADWCALYSKFVALTGVKGSPERAWMLACRREADELMGYRWTNRE